MIYDLKNKRFIISILLALMILLFSSLIYFNNKDGNKFINLFTSKKYAKSKEFYLSVVNTSDNKRINKLNDSIERFFINKSRELKDYSEKEHKKYDYSEELDILDQMLYYNIAADEINDNKNYIIKISKSRDSYNKAEKALKNSDYNKAIYYFNKVIKEDRNYKKSQKKIEQINRETSLILNFSYLYQVI